jgi:hypothetical protein
LSAAAERTLALTTKVTLQELLQAEDHVHRIGQRCCVTVQPGTADELMWPLIQDKLDFLNEVKLSHESFACEQTPVSVA